MRKTHFIVSLIAFAMISISNATAQSNEIIGKIEVNGRGEIMVEPNEFKYRIIINEQTTRGRVTINEAQQQLSAALKKLGVETSTALRLKDVESTTEKKRRATARTSAVYELTLNDSEQAQQLTPLLNKLAIGNIDLISTSHTKIAEYRSQARKLAVNDAITKANELATALGQGEAKFISIREYINYNSYNQPMLMMRTSNKLDYAASEGGSEVSAMEFAPIKVRCDVDAVFVASDK